MKIIKRLILLLFLLLLLSPVMILALAYSPQESLPEPFSHMAPDLIRLSGEDLMDSIQGPGSQNLVLSETLINQLLWQQTSDQLPSSEALTINYLYVDLEDDSLHLVSHLTTLLGYKTLLDMNFGATVDQDNLVIELKGLKLGHLPIPRALIQRGGQQVVQGLGEGLPQTLDLEQLTYSLDLEDLHPLVASLSVEDLLLDESSLRLTLGLNEDLLKGLTENFQPLLATTKASLKAIEPMIDEEDRSQVDKLMNQLDDMVSKDPASLESSQVMDLLHQAQQLSPKTQELLGQTLKEGIKKEDLESLEILLEAMGLSPDSLQTMD